MKRHRLFTSIAIAVLILVSQTVGFTPIQINHITSGSQDTDGGKSMAIYDDYVHLLWQEMDSTYTSFLSTSSDGGETFADPVQLPGDGPHIFGAVALTDDGDIGLVWDGIADEMIAGVFFTRSTDHGQTFNEPVEVAAMGFFPELLVDGDYVYVSYYEMTTDTTFAYFFKRSLDGGISFETPTQLSSVSFSHFKMDSPNSMTRDDNGDIYISWNDGRAHEEGTDVYIVRSTDNGASFGENVVVNVHNQADALLRTASDIDIGNGNMYAVWREEVTDSGDERRILFSRADLSDLVFDPEQLIISGGWSTPCLAAGFGPDVYVAYPQQGDHTNGLFCLKSSDEGATFPAEVLISQVGEYVKYPTIRVNGAGELNAVWTIARDNDEDDVYFAKGTINIAGVLEGFGAQPEMIQLVKNYPNPFNPTTQISFELSQSSAVELKVYDVMGQQVRLLSSGPMEAGEQHLIWDGRDDQGQLPSGGIYLAQIQAGADQKLIKMTLLK